MIINYNYFQLPLTLLGWDYSFCRTLYDMTFIYVFLIRAWQYGLLLDRVRIRETHDWTENNKWKGILCDKILR